MDPQLKRGVLEVAVLSAVSREESYGYKIIKDLSECVEISESTLYPILKRLEAAELLTARTSEHNGRLRKLYSITTSGKRRIDEFLESWKEAMDVYAYIRGGWTN